MAGLNAKQKRFVDEYLVDLNATQAAIRSGYSEKTAYAIGDENLRKPEIASAITKAQEKRAKRTEITQDKVIAELAKIAFGDLRDVMTWTAGGIALKSSAELTQEQAASISEISETQSEKSSSMRVKRHDKLKALELVGRHLGMFTDNVKVNVNNSFAAMSEEEKVSMAAEWAKQMGIK